jgi:uncharacterized protein with gpF-like domain
VASVRAYRKKWLRWHRSYEKRAYKQLIKTFRSWARGIDFEFMTESNYSRLIDEAIKRDQLFKNLEDIYTYVGLKHGERVGKGINRQVKLFSLEDFASVYLEDIINWLLDQGSRKVTTIEETYRNDLNNIITKWLQEGKSINEVARDIEKLVNRPDFYRWQAERIARTETTAAANNAAMMAGEISGFVTNKVWISAQDSRTRRLPEDVYDHLNMDEVQVGLSELFNVPGKEGPDALLYPGDPDGQAGNVINCRCTIAVVPATDRYGNFIETS